MTEEINQDLNAYIKANMKYLKIDDGESFTEEYQGYKIIPDNFNPGQSTIAWDFKLDTGNLVPWTNGTSRVAKAMAEFKPGDKLQVTRSGLGPKTSYDIKKVG